MDQSRSSKHLLTGLFSLPNKFLNFFVRWSLFDFVLDYFFKVDFLEILAIFVEWKVLADDICLGFRWKFIRPRCHFLVKHYPLHTAKYATGFLISDWLSSSWHGIDISTAITFWLSWKKCWRKDTPHCVRGWGKEHRERENEKWEQKRELEIKLLLGLGFIFIVPVTKLVARSPLTSQVYMNIDFKRGEYNIFLRIYYLGRISFLADCFILHIYMTWDTKKS